MAARIPARLSVSEGRKFGLTVGLAFLVLGGLLLWRGRERAAAGLLAVGGLLVLGGLVVPTHLGPIQRGWMGLARAISRVTTPVIMGVIYFLVIAPVGLAMRLFGRNALTAQRGRDSAWVSRDDARRGNLQHQF